MRERRYTYEVSAILSEIGTRIAPIIAFLLAITVVARGCDLIGLFDLAATQAARQAKGRVLMLWLLLVGLAVACTAVLSLDTTAVLLTPIVIIVAKRVRIPLMALVFTTLWLANTASLFLPVSNLTNLLAADKMRQWGMGTSGYLGMLAPPAIVATLATIVVIAILFRTDLLGSYDSEVSFNDHDRVAVVIGGVTCVGMAIAFVVGAPPWLAAGIGAAIIVATVAWRYPRKLGYLQPLWLMALGLLALFLVVEVARLWDLDALITTVAGQGDGWGALVRLSAVSAVSANLINNLPAYLALESAASSPVRLAAILIGVNCGPLVTLWGSLATLLWKERCQAREVSVSAGKIAGYGLICASVVVISATTALWVANA